MSSEHRPRRPQIVPVWADRVIGWVDEARQGITFWLFLVLIISGVGFWYFPQDLHARNLAQSLQTGAEWVTVDDVRVHVHYVGGRGANYDEVDQVSVAVPGSTGRVSLGDVNGAGLTFDPDFPDGWQAPSETTGYRPPLAVRVRYGPDGAAETAIAKADYDYWTHGNTDPETGLSIGIGGLLLAGLSLLVNRARLRRRARRREPTRSQARADADRQARITTTGRRGGASSPWSGLAQRRRR